MMNLSKTPPLDPRQHRAQTERRLIFGFLMIVYAAGGGLIWALYGQSAAFLAWACLTAALGIAGLVWLMLWLIGKWVEEK